MRVSGVISLNHGIELVSTAASKGELATLFKAAALGDRSPEEIAKAFQGSGYVVFARHRNRLIGAGRAFGDEVDCAVICDLAVHPEFQAQGLGGRILDALKQKVRHHRRVILYAKPGKESFYLKRRFHRMETAMMTSLALPVERYRKSGLIE